MQDINIAKEKIHQKVQEIKQEVDKHKTDYEKFKELAEKSQIDFVGDIEKIEYYSARMNDSFNKADRLLERQYGLILALQIINSN